MNEIDEEKGVLTKDGLKLKFSIHTLPELRRYLKLKQPRLDFTKVYFISDFIAAYSGFWLLSKN